MYGPYKERKIKEISTQTRKRKMKYELRKEDGTKLFRIVALIKGPWGPAGTLGGLIENEKNLSQ